MEVTPYIVSPVFEGGMLILRFVFLGIVLAVAGFLVFTSVRSTFFKMLFLEDFTEFMTYRPFGVKKMVKVWNKIKARLDTGLESEYKLAIIEADSMMDDTLKRMGYKGEALGERLGSLTGATLPNIEDLKETHQVRNKLIHEPDYNLPLDEANKLLGVYEKALSSLDVF